MTNDEYEYENMLRSELAKLHEGYRKAAEPYLKRLAHLEAMKPPRPIVVDITRLDPAALEVLCKSWRNG